MAMIECPECGNKMSDVARACPNCGYPIKQQKKGRANILVLAFLGCLCFAIGFVSGRVSMKESTQNPATTLTVSMDDSYSYNPDDATTHDTIHIDANESTLLFKNDKVSVWFDSVFMTNESDYKIKIKVDNKSSEKFGCCTGATYVNDIKIVVPSSTGFIYAEAGKTCFSEDWIQESELEDKNTGPMETFETCLEIYDSKTRLTDVVPIIIDPSLFPNLSK